MRRLAAVAFLVSTSALAESGVPFNTWCGVASCSCGAATCSCGQVCNVSQAACLSAQASFCGNDRMCAATCASFICELNVCELNGVRDGGTAGPDRLRLPEHHGRRSRCARGRPA